MAPVGEAAEEKNPKVLGQCHYSVFYSMTGVSTNIDIVIHIR